MGKLKLFFLLVLGLVLLIFIIGLLLPKERVVSRQTIYDAPAHVVFNIVTDNINWKYRSDLSDLKIISTEGNKQVWDEYTKDGQVIRFTTLEFNPYKLYSFKMEGKLFYGYWVSNYEETKNGKTIYTATENISMKNPFTRVLSYIFFDVEKYMEKQQEDVRKKIESM